MARAMLTAILCGSYKTEAAALSKSNLVRKILIERVDDRLDITRKFFDHIGFDRGGFIGPAIAANIEGSGGKPSRRYRRHLMTPGEP